VSERRFPLLRSHLPAGHGCLPSVPWDLVAPHERRARTNHGQSLDRLAERGGLSPGELWVLVHDRPLHECPPEIDAIAWLVAAQPQPGPAPAIP
jgi:hypothetical protein